jgi:hypothetical protein
MNPAIEVLQYVEARKRLYDQLEATKGRLDRVLNELLERAPTLNDLAQIEGLHREKRALFTGFIEIEDRFVSQLLALRSRRATTGEVQSFG